MLQKSARPFGGPRFKPCAATPRRFPKSRFTYKLYFPEMGVFTLYVVAALVAVASRLESSARIFSRSAFVHIYFFYWNLRPPDRARRDLFAWCFVRPTSGASPGITDKVFTVVP